MHRRYPPQLSKYIKKTGAELGQAQASSGKHYIGKLGFVCLIWFVCFISFYWYVIFYLDGLFYSFFCFGRLGLKILVQEYGAKKTNFKQILVENKIKVKSVHLV